MIQLLRLPWVPYVIMGVEIVWFVWFYAIEKDARGLPIRLLLMDDAMISMDYARSLAQGCGLVWYCGAEKVEGFTNPLWVFYMAFWHLFPISPNIAALPILLTGITTLFLQLIYTKKIAKLYFPDEVGVLAQWVLAFFMPSWVWHLGGLETGALAFMTTFLAYRTLVKQKERKPDILYLVLTVIGILIRLDFVLIGLAIGAFWSFRSRSKSHILTFLGVAIAVIGGTTWARWMYFGELLPNTYYLKVSSIPFFLRVANGLFTLLGNLLFSNLPFWALALYGAYRSFSHERFPLLTLTFFLFSIVGAYNVYIGGDAWEAPSMSNRYLSLLYPLFSIFIGTCLLEWRPVYQLISIGLISNGISLRMVYFVRLHPDVQPLTEWKSNRYSIFSPINIDKLTDSLSLSQQKSVIWLGPAGTTPYFYPNYKYRDYLGKCDKEVAYTSPSCYAPSLFYQLYKPGHTRYGIDKILSDSLSHILIAGETGRAGRDKTTCCEAETYLSLLKEKFIYDERGFWVRRR